MGSGTLTSEEAETPGSVSFEALFERERHAMVRVAYLITGSTAVSEEVAHDAFVEVYRRWGRLDRPGAYLRRCVVNGALRHNRRSGPPATPLDAGVEDGRPAAASPDGYDHTLDAVLRLRPRPRALVVLRYYAGLPHAEIADALGIPVGTVKSGLHNALAELRKVLS